MIFLPLLFTSLNASPPKIQWDISHCVDEIISPGVGTEQHSKVVVSRYYPSPMGNNWECEYKIQNPDSTMKIMVEWLYFDLARCELQNVTIVDWKEKNAVDRTVVRRRRRSICQSRIRFGLLLNRDKFQKASIMLDSCSRSHGHPRVSRSNLSE